MKLFAESFLPKMEEFLRLAEEVEKVLNLFSPNLILAISDEISPPGDIKKIKFVSQISRV